MGGRSGDTGGTVELECFVAFLSVKAHLTTEPLDEAKNSVLIDRKDERNRWW